MQLIATLPLASMLFRWHDGQLDLSTGGWTLLVGMVLLTYAIVVDGSDL